MKVLKRLLLLVLALVMCLSLFACSDEPSNDEPSTDDPVIDNPDNGKEDEKDESGLTVVENDFIIDYQALEGGKFYIVYEGADPTEVLYGNSMANDTQLYAPYWEIVEGKLEIQLEGDMMGAKADKIIKFKTDTKSYITYLTVNPITESYFIVDGGEANFKLEIAGIESAKFNGTDVASVTGITKDATGLTFTKELLATKLGHNAVEIKTADDIYVISVCAITKEDLRQPITFEDGKMSPFISVFGNTYKVVKGTDIADATIKAKYTGGYTYSYGSNTSNKINNEYCLEIEHKAGSMEPLQVYVSSYFVQQRLLTLSKIDAADAPDTWYEVCKDGYNRFMAENTAFFMGWRVFCTQADTLISGYYLNIGGKDIGGTEATYYGFYQANTVVRQLFNKKAYNLFMNANGEVVEPYFKVQFADVMESHKVYLDDICSVLTDTSMNASNMPLPTKLA